MVFALKRYLIAPWAGEYYSMKISTQNYPAVLADVQDHWNQAFANSPFNYFFLNDYFSRQYQADQQFGRIFSLFASLAIFIACLGLFGLSSYVTLQRTQEIGIRKVLGASVQSVVILLSRDFLWLVMLAGIITIPVIYYLVNSWLENYAYRMPLSGWLFVLPVVVVGVLAMITISIQTSQTALANPVKSLRSE